jgi:cell wall assembly regulator SMI1
MMELAEQRRPATAADLAAAEQGLAELGHRLPPSYRAFLEQHDGGAPVRNFMTFDRGDGIEVDVVVHSFLGVAPVEPPGSNLVGKASTIGEGLPAGVLPIAEDPYGNAVCIDTRDGRDGPVLFWDHEEGFDPPEASSLYEIAPDLATFLDRLGDLPPLASAPPKRGLKRLFGRR